MTANELLEVRDAYRERPQLEQRIVELECMRISPRIALYGNERVQASAKGDIQTETIAQIDKLIELYNAKLVECVKLTIAFEDALTKLSGRERQIMRMYYIHGLTWEKVCVELDISWMHLHRLRKKILEKIA